MQHELAPIADPRLRVVALILIAFGFSTLHTPMALAFMVIATLVLVKVFGQKPLAMARSLRWPGFVVGGLVILLPFVAGETVLATLGPVSLRAEGLAAAAGIALRFLCIIAAAITLLGPIPVPKLIAALHALGLPSLMADMTLLTLRHLEDLRRDLRRMRVAMQLRGAPPGFWLGQFRATGWALASLLLRSHARSVRIYHAMILRGHGAPKAAPATFRATRTDRGWLGAIFGMVLGLLTMEYLA